MPAACTRAFSQSGEGPTVTSWKTRAVKRGQSSSSSIEIVIQSAVRRSPTAGGLAVVERREIDAEDRVDVAGDAAHGEQVGAVGGHLELEHVVDERQARREWLAGRHPSPSTMIPSPSDEMSSSRSDRIMPSEVSPRSLERAMRRGRPAVPSPAARRRRCPPRRSSRHRRRSIAARPRRRRRGTTAGGRRSGACRPRARARRRSAPRPRPAQAARGARRPRPCRRRTRAAR